MRCLREAWEQVLISSAWAQYLPHPTFSRVAHSYVIIPFWNVLRKRGLRLEQQHVEAVWMEGKSTPVLAFVFQHNVGFGQEPDREATGEVLSRYTGPIWPKDWTICLARWLPDCTWTTISLWLVVHLLSFFYRFTKNLSPNKISVKFLKGEGELHNLELDETTLSDLLELPPWIRLTKAVCNRISAKASYCESALLSSLQ